MATYQTEVDALLTAIFNAIATQGTVQLTGGASGSVDGITVNAVEIMSGVEAFDTSLAITAQNVAANINANTSIPDYKAVANGDKVVIEAVDGSAADAFVVVSSATTITTADTNMLAGTGTPSQKLSLNPSSQSRDRNLARNFMVEFLKGVKNTTLFSGSTILEEFKHKLNGYLTETINS